MIYFGPENEPQGRCPSSQPEPQEAVHSSTDSSGTWPLPPEQVWATLLEDERSFAGVPSDPSKSHPKPYCWQMNTRHVSEPQPNQQGYRYLTESSWDHKEHLTDDLRAIMHFYRVKSLSSGVAYFTAVAKGYNQENVWILCKFFKTLDYPWVEMRRGKWKKLSLNSELTTFKSGSNYITFHWKSGRNGGLWTRIRYEKVTCTSEMHL